jgi:acetolactate synthase I/II/III large subunit
VSDYTASDLISDFIAEFLHPDVFLVTGGACAFMVDAIGRNPKTRFTCFQHEQSAAMAADAIWRTRHAIGVTMATSGPGATNLITGIACSWFDSIPSVHFTGQVNKAESAASLGVNVRQAGFQETDIVSMVSTITKFACRVDDIDQLPSALNKALMAATTGRMGPVLLDIAMNVQKEEFDVEARDRLFDEIHKNLKTSVSFKSLELREIFSKSNRPLVVIGGGASVSKVSGLIQDWCEREGVPFVSTWAAVSDMKENNEKYLGSLGVYGSRFANWAVQAADTIVFFGSRLDNRQRTANPKGFAPFAKKVVIDIDEEELAKFRLDSTYQTILFDLRGLIFDEIKDSLKADFSEWKVLLSSVRSMTSYGFEAANPTGGLNPYEAVIHFRTKIPTNAIVVSDCGANLCWVYQAWVAGPQKLFTAGGNSPMGYSLPAAIGAQLSNPDSPVICFIGDGGIQMNIQELQTISHYKLPIQIVIQNNFGYGIIKQFQDSYFDGRHFASGIGYSVPSFRDISKSYGIDYVSCSTVEEIKKLELDMTRARVIELILPSDSLITPKVEMNRFIHDQFPYGDNQTFKMFPTPYPSRVSEI